MNKFKSYEKIRFIFEANNNNWLRVSDIVNVRGELFVGHKASTRICEMQKRGEIESKWATDGRYKFYRLKEKVDPPKEEPQPKKTFVQTVFDFFTRFIIAQ